MNYNEYLQHQPKVQAFFDPRTNTISYVVSDPATNQAAIIDSVLDYEPNSGTIYHESADQIIKYIQDNQLNVTYILETHIHADHLSAAKYLQSKLGGKIAAGKEIINVQTIFGQAFNLDETFKRDGSQFDHLWNDQEKFQLGQIPAFVLHTPGHTPADYVYIIGNSIFAGDTLFMPDYGSARCDFPGGSATKLYDSVQKLFQFPDEMQMYMCHDYLPNNRTEYTWQTTIAEQKQSNIHLKQGTDPTDFIRMRTDRDAKLEMPKLIIPSIQINLRAGELPIPESNNISYLKTPINGIFSKLVK